MTSVITVSNILVIVKLRQRKKWMKWAMNGVPAQTSSLDAKVTRAALITVGTYLCLYIQTVTITVMFNIVDVPHPTVILSISLIVYFHEHCCKTQLSIT